MEWYSLIQNCTLLVNNKPYLSEKCVRLYLLKSLHFLPESLPSSLNPSTPSQGGGLGNVLAESCIGGGLGNVQSQDFTGYSQTEKMGGKLNRKYRMVQFDTSRMFLASATTPYSPTLSWAWW